MRDWDPRRADMTEPPPAVQKQGALFESKCRWGRLGERRRVSAWLYVTPAGLRLAEAIAGLPRAERTHEIPYHELVAVELRTRITGSSSEASVVLRALRGRPLAIEDLPLARAEELAELVSRLMRQRIDGLTN